MGTDFAHIARAIARPFLAVAISLLLFAVVLMVGEYNVLGVYKSLVVGAVGSPGAIGSTLRWATSLILAGLAVTIPLRAGLFNVGVEGQLYLAGFVAALIGIYVDLPAILVQPLVLFAAMAVGILWALIPTLLLTYTRASEIVTTLMLNFVALGVVNYLVNNYFRTELSAAAVMTEQVRPEARFPSIFPPYPVSYGILIALALAFLIQIFLRKTTYGYEIRMIGLNRNFARFGGISIKRGWLISMLASGAERKRFSATVSDGTSEKCWCTMPMPARIASVASEKWHVAPSTRISPSSGWMIPAAMRISVDLPAPFSPTRAWISPGRTAKSTL